MKRTDIKPENRCKFRDPNKWADGQCPQGVVSARGGGLQLRGTVCYQHGGRLQLNKLQHDLMELLLAKAVNQYGLHKKDIAPAQAILESVQEAAANVEWLREKISKLALPDEIREDYDPTDPKEAEIFADELGLTGHSDNVGRGQMNAAARLMLSAPNSGKAMIYSPNHLGVNIPHVLIQMYNEEREKLVRFSKTAIECNVAEAMVRIEAYKAEQIGKLINKLIDSPKIALNEVQKTVFRKMVGKGLRELAAGDDAEEAS